MDIPPYKIHNVLKLYTKRLIQDRQAPHPVPERYCRISDSEDAAGPDRQKAFIRRISENLICRARALRSEKTQVREKIAPWQTLPKEAGTILRKGAFVYYAIEKGIDIVKHTLAPGGSSASEDSSFSEKKKIALKD
ncbi:RNA polymerase sigma factor, sigma-70 family [Desulfonema ishimotonii]|uniref:RNA polymerase sigma factor, sigma-70 family n=2 Tax=Desulfonema ishimotonii TaxID=45657 RepID=A0A401FS65_9BACT|nr:RNA polymerase sigma factor, sigma-70 family [Desulfonema ishimotonii]